MCLSQISVTCWFRNVSHCLSLYVGLLVHPSISSMRASFHLSLHCVADLSRTVRVLVEVRAVHSQSQIALHTRMKGLLQSRGSISGTEAPVVPWRMTLSVECLWGTVLCATGVVLHNSIPKAITPQKVLEELSLVSFRHPQSQALIRTKVTSNRHSRPPCKVFSLFLLCFWSYRLLNKVTGVSCRVPESN